MILVPRGADSMRSDAIVDMQDVSFTYEGSASPALSHASFRIIPGEFVAVLGHNGQHELVWLTVPAAV